MSKQNRTRNMDDTFFGYGSVSPSPSQCTEIWTEERVERLKALWQEGLSASQIAVRLGGTTRNGVIGKVHRLGLPARAIPSMRPRTRKSIRQTNRYMLNRPRIAAGKKPIQFRDTAVPVEIPPPRPDDIARVNLIDLEPHHCKYPVGEPTKGFCGLNRHPGSPYCTGHYHLCFRVADVVPRRTQPAKQLETA